MAPTTTQRVAAQVRRELADRRLSGRALADALGWSHSSTARRLRGAHAFDVAELEQVAAFLGLTVTDLVAPAERPLLRATG